MNEPNIVETHDREFFQVVLPRLKSFYPIKITRKQTEQISEVIVASFGLSNKFQLKDKFDGAKFLNSRLKLYTSLVAIYKQLGVEMKPIEDISKILHEGYISIDDKQFRIVNFNFGEIPEINTESEFLLDGLIFALHRDEFNSYLCGFIYLDEIYEILKLSSIYERPQKRKVKFKNFEILHPLSDLNHS